MVTKSKRWQFSRYAVKSALTVPGARRAFTLIELLAVCVVIAVLAGIMLGLVRSVQRKMDRSQTQADIAGLSMAIESFRSDHGVYPTSSLVRVSCYPAPGMNAALYGAGEVNNSGLLLAQLSPPNGKAYYHFRRAQTNSLTALVTNSTGGVVFGLTSNLTVIVDSWGTPLNYYCTYPRLPVPTYTNVVVGASYTLYCMIGGQMNVNTFDLWSYGPDTFTYLPTGPAFYWNTPSYAVDDITNWKQ